MARLGIWMRRSGLCFPALLRVLHSCTQQVRSFRRWKCLGMFRSSWHGTLGRIGQGSFATRTESMSAESRVSSHSRSMYSPANADSAEAGRPHRRNSAMWHMVEETLAEVEAMLQDEEPGEAAMDVAKTPLDSPLPVVVSQPPSAVGITVQCIHICSRAHPRALQMRPGVRYKIRTRPLQRRRSFLCPQPGKWFLRSTLLRAMAEEHSGTDRSSVHSRASLPTCISPWTPAQDGAEWAPLPKEKTGNNAESLSTVTKADQAPRSGYPVQASFGALMPYESLDQVWASSTYLDVPDLPMLQPRDMFSIEHDQERVPTSYSP